MDKKMRIKLLVITLIILIVFPILINRLMFYNLFPVKGEIDTWISTLGTFWGAIIGGVISGILTLIGVNITILRQDRKEVIKSYPERRKLGDDITQITSEAYRVIHDFINNSAWKELYSYSVKVFDMRDELLTKASKVSDEVYEELRTEFFVDIRSLIIELKVNPKNIDELNSYIRRFYVHAANMSSLVDSITTEYKRIKNN